MKTLGELVDILTITQLKNAHADTEEKKRSTSEQIVKISKEISNYMNDVLAGNITDLEFPQNKVYKKKLSIIEDPSDDMSFGELVTGLSKANTLMWINQEYVYDFENVPEDQRVNVIDKCAALNIERSQYIDAINKWMAKNIND